MCQTPNSMGIGMAHQLVSFRLLLSLTVGALVLLLACLVALGLAELLGAMGDAAGSVALKYVALALAALAAVDVLCLVMALALRTLSDAEQDGEPPG